MHLHVSLKHSLSTYGDVLDGSNVNVPQSARHLEEHLLYTKTEAGVAVSFVSVALAAGSVIFVF